MIDEVKVRQGRHKETIQRGDETVVIQKEGCFVNEIRTLVEEPEMILLEIHTDRNPQVMLNTTNHFEMHLYAGSDPAIVNIELTQQGPFEEGEKPLPWSIAVGSVLDRSYWLATRKAGTGKVWKFTDIGDDDEQG